MNLKLKLLQFSIWSPILQFFQTIENLENTNDIDDE